MAAHPDWVRDKKINLLFQTGESPLPGAPDVPQIRKLVSDPIDRQALEFLLAREVIGRPFVAPPGVPAERAAVLREAFMATLRDPQFLADAKTQKLDTDPVGATEVDALLRKAAAAPRQVIDRVKQSLERH